MSEVFRNRGDLETNSRIQQSAKCWVGITNSLALSNFKCPCSWIEQLIVNNYHLLLYGTCDQSSVTVFRVEESSIQSCAVTCCLVTSSAGLVVDSRCICHKWTVLHGHTKTKIISSEKFARQQTWQTYENVDNWCTAHKKEAFRMTTRKYGERDTQVSVC